MKKIISLALILAMALCLFAGCAEEAPAASTGLADAKEYLYTIYKDDPEVTTADYNLVSVVAIDGVTYNVSWAVDVAEIAIVPGENIVTVDLPDASEVEIAYTLTATIADAAGATETVTFAHKVPAVEVADISEGDMIVLYNPADGLYTTGIDYIYTSSSGNQKHELVLTENKAEALPMSIQENDNGTISFIAEGLYLYCDGTDVKFVAEQGEYTEFVLEPAEGGQYIRCSTANYSGKAQYLELYSGYMTCYSFNDEKTGLYTFELQDAADAAGKLQAASETPAETEPQEAAPVVTGDALPTVSAPVVGTAYKFGMLQGNLGQTLYITGNTANKEYYLETTADAAAAVDVYVEEIEGGYHLYFLNGDVKTYIDIYCTDSGYVNIRLTDAPTAVLVWNTEFNTFTATIQTADGPVDHYMGTYKEYNTLSASKLSYAATSFPATLYSAE